MRCVVHVRGPGMRVKPAPDGFVVGSEEIPGAEFVAQTLVEARLPVTDIRATTDPLVAATPPARISSNSTSTRFIPMSLH